MDVWREGEVRRLSSQALERRVAKPYSFGKRFLDEFLSTLNVFLFDNKGLCCVLSEDVYSLIPLPALISTITAWQPQEGKFAHKDPKKDVKCLKDLRSWTVELWSSLPPPSLAAKVPATSKRAPRLTRVLWQIRDPRRYHPTPMSTLPRQASQQGKCDKFRPGRKSPVCGWCGVLHWHPILRVVNSSWGMERAAEARCYLRSLVAKFAWAWQSATDVF